MNRLIIVAVALTLAACGGGGHTVDTKAWGAELQQQGVHVRDWASYEDVWKKECAKDVDSLAIFLTLSGAPPASQVRTAFKYQCPDQQGKLDKAYASIQEGTSNVDDACQTPASERTEQQQQLAEAMGC